MKHKKTFLLVVTIVCIGLMAPFFSAEVRFTDEKKKTYQPMWENSQYIKTYVEVSSSGLRACANIITDKSTSITGTLYLQKYVDGDWKVVKGWKFSSKSSIKLRKYYVAGPGKYRTLLFVNVGGEDTNEISEEKEVK